MKPTPDEMRAIGEEGRDGKPKWPKRPPLTAEDRAAIAVLDELRAGAGEKPPPDLPLACIVKVTEYVEIHKANEAYAMVRVADVRLSRHGEGRAQHAVRLGPGGAAGR